MRMHRSSNNGAAGGMREPVGSPQIHILYYIKVTSLFSPVLRISDLEVHNIFKVMCNPNFNIFLNQDSNIYSKKNSSAPPYT